MNNDALTIHLPRELKAQLQKLANHENKLLNALCVECLQGAIDSEVVSGPEGKLYPWDAAYPKECRA